MQQKDKAIMAAIGEIDFDLVIKNVNFVNILTEEIYLADIGICDGRIAHITQPGEPNLTGPHIFDGSKKYAFPGLIDTHVHMESSMMTPAHMCDAIVVHGTTTLVSDPHEIGNVMGVDGVNYMLKATEDIPLQVFVLAPSCVPATEDLETSGAVFDAHTIDSLLSHERVIGLAEVMDFPGVIHQSDRMMSIIAAAKKHNGFLQGHSPSLTGRELSAYQASGVNSCHETSFTEEAIYKLRAGMTLECRESSIVHDIKALAPAIKQLNYPMNTTICTDDREPDDLLSQGHIDHVIRRCVQEGIPVIKAIRMATYQASLLTGLHDRGLLCPGRRADIVLADDLEQLHVTDVFVGGSLTAQNGKMLTPTRESHLPEEEQNTVILHKIPELSDFCPKAGGTSVKVNVMSFRKEAPILTDLETIVLPVKENTVDISGHDDLAYIAVFERHGKKGSHCAGIVKGLGLKYGAIASTLSHDSHNLVVVGKNPQDMKKAADALIKCHGGLACVLNEQVEHLLELPIAGLMSPKPIQELAPLTYAMKKAILDYGIIGECPIIQMGSLSLPVIPHVRLTDLGLADVLKQEFIPIIVSE